jgi:hypothetical protein
MMRGKEVALAERAGRGPWERLRFRGTHRYMSCEEEDTWHVRRRIHVI